MRESISIVLSGEAGQGLQTVEEFLVETLTQETYVFSSKEVMSRVRGGNNSVEIRVSDQPIQALRYTIDILFLFNDHALDRLIPRLTPSSVIYGEAAFLKSVPSVYKTKEVTFSDLGKQAGNRLYENTAMFGYIAGMITASSDNAKALISKRFFKRGEDTVTGNLKAFDLGYDLGQLDPDKPKVIKPTKFIPKRILSGNDALSKGAIAGGVNYVAAYPMSPGTTLMTLLEDKSRDYEILVEQAEDEIAALNMVLGAWYAGARALTTTSGGGFALMTEAVSLSGITETPAVIHVAQRPGPATGLPTRTEQADLNLVLYAGHGEFPRMIFAPGRLEDGVEVMSRAFYMADKYQIPVFVLSDQYWLESMSQVDQLSFNPKYLESFVLETKRDYQRYAFDQSGISPRGIPGYGKGYVKVDSDEHDEAGSITESFTMRVKMQDKRLHKFELMKTDIMEPLIGGSLKQTHLVLSWGSTYGVIEEALSSHPEWDLTHIHFIQVYPLPASLSDIISKAKSILVIENNSTGQFANLIQMTFGVKVTQRILKYNGEPYHIDELIAKMEDTHE
ncbi:MAG: 2-oxoacid:acceptor oxidoreductase subunit alpha [Erysipelotrichaceae bacterium]